MARFMAEEREKALTQRRQVQDKKVVDAEAEARKMAEKDNFEDVDMDGSTSEESGKKGSKGKRSKGNREKRRQKEVENGTDKATQPRKRQKVPVSYAPDTVQAIRPEDLE